jgi:hypothetical protein
MNRLIVERLMVDGFPLNVERSRRFKGIMHGRKTVGALSMNLRWLLILIVLLILITGRRLRLRLGVRFHGA